MLTLIILWFIVNIGSPTPNCLVLQATNFYSASKSTFDPNSCFEVQISDLKEMIVHTQSSIVGFTFNFNDNTTKSYIENSTELNNFTINLRSIDLIGVNIYIENGVEGLQFQLFDWNLNKKSISQTMGQSSGCLHYLNSSSVKINYFKIDSLRGCVDEKISNYFPFLAFSYSFSQCPFRNVSTILTSKSYFELFSNHFDTKIFNKSHPVIQTCRNIDTTTINNIPYNLVVDRNVGVHLYDSNWMYKSTFNMPNIYYGIVANGFFYFSTINTYGIVKTSLNSSTAIKSYGDAGKYRGLYYDSIGSVIIAAGCNVNKVDILDLDLNLNSSISFPGQCPHGIAVFNSKIYVAIWGNGIIAVISNGTIEKTYPAKCSSNLAGISVDAFGYFALSCSGNGQVFLYDTSMQYTNKSIAFGGVYDARFDTNKKLGICGGTNAAIYN
jgi:hypothetical protein